MTEREAREILHMYASTSPGGLSLAIEIVLAADEAQQAVALRLERALHDAIKRLEELDT